MAADKAGQGPSETTLPVVASPRIEPYCRVLAEQNERLLATVSNVTTDELEHMRKRFRRCLRGPDGVVWGLGMTDDLRVQVVRVEGEHVVRTCVDWSGVPRSCTA